MEPQIHYAKTSDGVNIAWFAVGAGPAYMWPGGAGTPVENFWRVPEVRGVFDSIARGATLILNDPRGFGLSDRGAMDFSCDAMVRDLEAVSDAAAPDRFILQTFSQMSIPALAYAAKHPERVGALVLLNGILRGSDLSPNWWRLMRLAEEDWESAIPLLSRANEPSYASATTLERVEELFRLGTPREAYVEFTRAVRIWDATEAARQVQAPAIVVHYTQSLLVPMESCRTLALTLPNGTFASAAADEGGTRLEHVQSAVRGFLRGVLAREPGFGSRGAGAPATGTALPGGTAVILFLDIADSTALTERLGDTAFRAASRRLDQLVREAIGEAGGTPVEGKVLGDGVMGVFSSAAQAIEAALRCLEVGRQSEQGLHIGLHAGDVTREGTNVYGGAVNIASRICDLCEPGEALVSQTVRDLARTSARVAFDDRGAQALKGIGDPVHLFAIRPPG